MKLKGTPIPGFRIDKTGKLIKDPRRLNVSARLQAKAKSKARVGRRRAAS